MANPKKITKLKLNYKYKQLHFLFFKKFGNVD